MVYICTLLQVPLYSPFNMFSFSRWCISTPCYRFHCTVPLICFPSLDGVYLHPATGSTGWFSTEMSSVNALMVSESTVSMIYQYPCIYADIQGVSLVSLHICRYTGCLIMVSLHICRYTGCFISILAFIDIQGVLL